MKGAETKMTVFMKARVVRRALAAVRDRDGDRWRARAGGGARRDRPARRRRRPRRPGKAAAVLIESTEPGGLRRQPAGSADRAGRSAERERRRRRGSRRSPQGAGRPASRLEQATAVGRQQRSRACASRLRRPSAYRCAAPGTSFASSSSPTRGDARDRRCPPAPRPPAAAARGGRPTVSRRFRRRSSTRSAPITRARRRRSRCAGNGRSDRRRR